MKRTPEQWVTLTSQPLTTRWKSPSNFSRTTSYSPSARPEKPAAERRMIVAPTVATTTTETTITTEQTTAHQERPIAGPETSRRNQSRATSAARKGTLLATVRTKPSLRSAQTATKSMCSENIRKGVKSLSRSFTTQTVVLPRFTVTPPLTVNSLPLPSTQALDATLFQSSSWTA